MLPSALLRRFETFVTKKASPTARRPCAALPETERSSRASSGLQRAAQEANRAQRPTSVAKPTAATDLSWPPNSPTASATETSCTRPAIERYAETAYCSWNPFKPAAKTLNGIDSTIPPKPRTTTCRTRGTSVGSM